MEDDIIKLYKSLVDKRDFVVITEEDFFKEIRPLDKIILIEDKKIWKGKQVIWKGKIEEMSIDSFILFFQKEIYENSYKNYIIRTITESPLVYTINEDGTILKYEF